MPFAYFFYQNWLFSQWAQEQAGNGGFVCGTGIVLLLSFCAAVTAAFSGTAVLLGLIGYRRMAKPRPGKRLLEIAAIACATPLAFVAGIILI
ncbi:hypothetical protein [Duganella sp. CF458]|uniref:hypothetical protein n=1 Tax=Duganella sp. CF458 TaxID=1884368 RepID=UPI000B80756A|nr:hypothetical protein [Duganella sp. CF458]